MCDKSECFTDYFLIASILLFTQNRVEVFNGGTILYKLIFDHIYIFTAKPFAFVL